MTGEEAVEALERLGVMSFDKWHPYDRKRLEYALEDLIDGSIDEALKEAADEQA